MPSRSSPVEPGLLIHCASGAAWVALGAGDRLLACQQGVLRRGGARELPGLVEAVRQGQRPPAWVRVSQGPGSFTGIRVGLAFARGYGRGLGIPVSGFGVLEALAWGGAGLEEPTYAAVDALRGEAFAGEYLRVEGRLEVLAEPGLVPWVDLEKQPRVVVEAGGKYAGGPLHELDGRSLLEAGLGLPGVALDTPPAPRWSRPSYAEEAGTTKRPRGIPEGSERE